MGWGRGLQRPRLLQPREPWRPWVVCSLLRRALPLRALRSTSPQCSPKRAPRTRLSLEIRWRLSEFPSRVLRIGRSGRCCLSCIFWRIEMVSQNKYPQSMQISTLRAPLHRAFRSPACLPDPSFHHLCSLCRVTCTFRPLAPFHLIPAPPSSFLLLP